MEACVVQMENYEPAIRFRPYTLKKGEKELFSGTYQQCLNYVSDGKKMDNRGGNPQAGECNPTS